MPKLIPMRRDPDATPPGGSTPGGSGVYPPQPARRRMPAGWKPDQEFDYVTLSESFYCGTRYFARGDHVRRDDPMALKLLYECPEVGPPGRPEGAQCKEGGLTWHSP
jgi:hypothetical protein